MRQLLFIFLVLLIVPGVHAQDSTLNDTVTSAPGITIESSVDRSEIYIGDLIMYRLSITYDSTIEITPPPIGINLGAFDVRDYEFDDETRLEDGRIKLESRFQLTTFTTGDYIIPPIPVEFMLPDSTRKILISEPMPIKVKSLLAEGGDTVDIRDIKGPISVAKGIPPIYIIGGAIAVLIIAVALYIWWRRRHKKGEEEFVDPRPPWEIAFERLAILKEKNYTVSGEFKQYYIELTETVRAFLQGVYSLPVMDMTTFEFMSIIRAMEIDTVMHDRFQAFLEYGDLVKFAKLEPELKQMEDDYIEAWAIIDEVRKLELSRQAAEDEAQDEEKEEEEPVTVGEGEAEEDV